LTRYFVICAVSDTIRSLHSWYPRHCPAAASSSLSSQLACPAATGSSRGGESSSTSLSSPEPTSLQTVAAAAAAAAAADDFRFDRRSSAATAVNRHGLNRYRHLGIGSAFRAGTAPSLLAAKRSKMHLQHHQQPHHVKKPLNAFMLFMKEMRSKVIDECTLKESAAINQILGRKVCQTITIHCGFVFITVYSQAHVHAFHVENGI
jgi:hypothetical protein